VSAIGLIVGALAVNRAIAQAKIPAFVKLIDKNMVIIENEKDMPEQDVTNSYNDIAIEKFGSAWELLDLDMRESLGMKVEKEGEEKNLSPSDMIGGGK